MLGQSLLGKQILSLQIGQPIGVINEAIINPFNLKIEGWHATNSDSRKHVILLSQDVREILPEGLVVNDHEALSSPGELIRLKEVTSHQFNLLGKSVVSNHKRKLGRVTDYAFDSDNFYIQKLHISQSIVKSFTGGALLIDRSQIIEVTHQRITVNEATAQDSSPIPAVA